MQPKTIVDCDFQLDEKAAQKAEEKVHDEFSDYDWPGCLVTGRSTSSSSMRHGQHILQVVVFTQATVVLSSGETEFYAAVRTVYRALDCAALARDTDVRLTTCLATDLSAAKGFTSCRSAGERPLHRYACLVAPGRCGDQVAGPSEAVRQGQPGGPRHEGTQRGRHSVVLGRSEPQGGGSHHGGAFEGRGLSSGYAALMRPWIGSATIGVWVGVGARRHPPRRAR